MGPKGIGDMQAAKRDKMRHLRRYTNLSVKGVRVGVANFFFDQSIGINKTNTFHFLDQSIGIVETNFFLDQSIGIDETNSVKIFILASKFISVNILILELKLRATVLGGMWALEWAWHSAETNLGR